MARFLWKESKIKHIISTIKHLQKNHPAVSIFLKYQEEKHNKEKNSTMQCWGGSSNNTCQMSKNMG